LFRDFVGAATELADHRDGQGRASTARIGADHAKQAGDGRIDEPTPPRPAARLGVQDLVGGHERVAESFAPSASRDEPPAVAADDEREPIIRLPGTERPDRADRSERGAYADSGRATRFSNGHMPYDLGGGYEPGGGKGDRPGEAGGL
jgi:hypothetical protein